MNCSYKIFVVFLNNSVSKIVLARVIEMDESEVKDLIEKGEIFELESFLISNKGFIFKEGDEKGHSAFTLAVQMGKNEVAKAILRCFPEEQDFILSEGDAQSSTALILAVKQGNTAMVEALCEVGIDINQLDKDGKTALYYAHQYQNTDIVNTLLANGAYNKGLK